MRVSNEKVVANLDGVLVKGSRILKIYATI